MSGTEEELLAEWHRRLIGDGAPEFTGLGGLIAAAEVAVEDAFLLGRQPAPASTGADYRDALNALLPDGMSLEWVAAEPVIERPAVDARFEAHISRRILKAFRLPHRVVFPTAPSCLNAAYRQRQRNRVKRRLR